MAFPYEGTPEAPVRSAPPPPGTGWEKPKTSFRASPETAPRPTVTPPPQPQPQSQYLAPPRAGLPTAALQGSGLLGPARGSAASLAQAGMLPETYYEFGMASSSSSSSEHVVLTEDEKEQSDMLAAAGPDPPPAADPVRTPPTADLSMTHPQAASRPPAASGSSRPTSTVNARNNMRQLRQLSGNSPTHQQQQQQQHARPPPHRQRSPQASPPSGRPVRTHHDRAGASPPTARQADRTEVPRPPPRAPQTPTPARSTHPSLVATPARSTPGTLGGNDSVLSYDGTASSMEMRAAEYEAQVREGTNAVVSGLVEHIRRLEHDRESMNTALAAALAEIASRTAQPATALLEHRSLGALQPHLVEEIQARANSSTTPGTSRASSPPQSALPQPPMALALPVHLSAVVDTAEPMSRAALVDAELEARAAVRVAMSSVTPRADRDVSLPHPVSPPTPEPLSSLEGSPRAQHAVQATPTPGPAPRLLCSPMLEDPDDTAPPPLPRQPLLPPTSSLVDSRPHSTRESPVRAPMSAHDTAPRHTDPVNALTAALTAAGIATTVEGSGDGAPQSRGMSPPRQAAPMQVTIVLQQGGPSQPPGPTLGRDRSLGRRLEAPPLSAPTSTGPTPTVSPVRRMPHDDSVASLGTYPRGSDAPLDPGQRPPVGPGGPGRARAPPTSLGMTADSSFSHSQAHATSGPARASGHAGSPGRFGKNFPPLSASGVEEDEDATARLQRAVHSLRRSPGKVLLNPAARSASGASGARASLPEPRGLFGHRSDSRALDFSSVAASDDRGTSVLSAAPVGPAGPASAPPPVRPAATAAAPRARSEGLSPEAELVANLSDFEQMVRRTIRLRQRLEYVERIKFPAHAERRRMAHDGLGPPVAPRASAERGDLETAQEVQTLLASLAALQPLLMEASAALHRDQRSNGDSATPLALAVRDATERILQALRDVERRWEWAAPDLRGSRSPVGRRHSTPLPESAATALRLPFAPASAAAPQSGRISPQRKVPAQLLDEEPELGGLVSSPDLGLPAQRAASSAGRGSPSVDRHAVVHLRSQLASEVTRAAELEDAVAHLQRQVRDLQDAQTRPTGPAVVARPGRRQPSPVKAERAAPISLLPASDSPDSNATPDPTKGVLLQSNGSGTPHATALVSSVPLRYTSQYMTPQRGLAHEADIWRAAADTPGPSADVSLTGRPKPVVTAPPPEVSAQGRRLRGSPVLPSSPVAAAQGTLSVPQESINVSAAPATAEEQANTTEAEGSPTWSPDPRADGGPCEVELEPQGLQRTSSGQLLARLGLDVGTMSDADKLALAEVLQRRGETMARREGQKSGQ